MAQATITARVNDADKATFDAFCGSVGLNTSTAINLFVKPFFANGEYLSKSPKQRIRFTVMQIKLI